MRESTFSKFLNELSGIFRAERSRIQRENEIYRLLGVHPRNVYRVDRLNRQILQLTCYSGGKVTFQNFYDTPEFRSDVLQTIRELNPEAAFRL